MTRLRRVSATMPGLGRRRRGRGFEYLDLDGRRITDPAVVERIRDLVIPPAWRDVWICADPRGHLQAVGTDARGRRQYLYHPAWREHRDQRKHARVLLVARRLPAARREVEADLAERGLSRERALACAFRLLDLGFFRVGGEEYAEENGSFGLATLLRRHVRVRRDHRLSFDYLAKSGQVRRIVLADEEAHRVVATMARYRSPEEQLFGYRVRGRWHDITSSDINDYVHGRLGDATAKDFRTWHATVLASAVLAHHWLEADGQGRTPMSRTARDRAVRATMKEVSGHLGNTPSVARASYVDPRVIDLFGEGRTIERAVRRLGHASRPALTRSATSGGAQGDGVEIASGIDRHEHAVLERAVLRLLG